MAKYEESRALLLESYARDIEHGLSDETAAADGLRQQRFFFAHLAEFERLYPGKFVAVAGEQVFVEPTAALAMQRALDTLPNRQFYVGEILAKPKAQSESEE